MKIELVIFKSQRQLLGFLQACMIHEIKIPTGSAEQQVIKNALIKLFKVQGVITLEDLIKALPREMHIGQPNCTSEKVIPIILALCDALNSLSATIKCSFDITGEKTKPTLIKGRSVWDILHVRFPKPKDFFEWLKNFKPTGEMTGTNWSQVYDSFVSALKKLDYEGKHPLDLLKDALPKDWNGITKIEQNEIRKTREGLPALLIKFIIPALTEILGQIEKR